MSAGIEREKTPKLTEEAFVQNFLSILILIPALFLTSLSAAKVDSNPNLTQFLFDRTNGIHTDAFIVIKEGTTLYEKYARGYGPHTKHFSWSMAKTFGGILIAQAIDEGCLGLRDPVSRWLPQVKTKATIQDLLNMSSGIKYLEEYAGVPVNSDATKMLYLDGPKNGFAAYTASLPTRKNETPGSHYYYSSGDANLLMAVLEKSISDRRQYDQYPWEKLFKPLGIPSATFEQDSAGTFVGSSYIYMTPKDYQKVGEMLMNRGKVNGVQVIPTWYFESMNVIANGVQKSELAGTDPMRAYSTQITTNRPIIGRQLLSQYPDLPEDSLIMIGHQGQLVIASPSQKLIIVRLATDKKDSLLDRQKLFSLVKGLMIEKGLAIQVARDSAPNQYAHRRIVVEKKENESASMEDYMRVPQLIRALGAKEMCSCVYVSRRKVAQCEEDLKNTLPVLPKFTFDLKNLTVTTHLGMGDSHSLAVYVNERLGCKLK